MEQGLSSLSRARSSTKAVEATGPQYSCILQGSEQMSKFGVNVPPGIPVFSLDEIDNAASKMKSPDGQVSPTALLISLSSTALLCYVQVQASRSQMSQSHL